MQRKGVLCIGILALLLTSMAALVHADNGGYEVRPYVPDSTADQHMITSQEESFWELPLWYQMFFLSGTLASLLVAIKLMPFAFLKLRRKNNNQNRESIYRHISDHPGCTVSDISRHEEMNVGSVRYHVDQLRDARRIVQVKFRKFVRLFRNSGAYDEREIAVISALHVRNSRAILLLIRDNPGLSNKQIAEKLDINESVAHTYLSGLLRENIIRYEKKSQQKVYFLENDVDAILLKLTCAFIGQNKSATT